MIVIYYIFALSMWSAVGALIIGILDIGGVEICQSKGGEFFNPFYCYKHARVNWFGAFMMAFGFALLSPLWAAIFWFYKLCTVGRR